jgi:hypothetical protein
MFTRKCVPMLASFAPGGFWRLHRARVLYPILAPRGIVVMDKLQVPTRAQRVGMLIEARGVRLLYLSPIDLYGSKLKMASRRTKARAREALEAALAEALKTMTPADAHGWFGHCGYTL